MQAMRRMTTIATIARLRSRAPTIPGTPLRSVGRHCFGNAGNAMPLGLAGSGEQRKGGWVSATGESL